MKHTRREFLIGLAAVAASAKIAATPVLTVRRPYVSKSSGAVSYIGKHCGFIGAQCVESVGDWNGTCYPVTLRNNGYGSFAGFETYPDSDLADFLREVPERFWHLPISEGYNNVHEYVRYSRYGIAA